MRCEKVLPHPNFLHAAWSPTPPMRRRRYAEMVAHHSDAASPVRRGWLLIAPMRPATYGLWLVAAAADLQWECGWAGCVAELLGEVGDRVSAA